MRRLLFTLLAVAALPGCSSIDPVSWIPSHKLDVYQGNPVTQDMVDRLKPGMTKQQVRAIMGTPLLNDPFHADRWGYNYTVTRDNRIKLQKNVTVFFDSNGLSRVEGEPLPAEKPGQIVPVAPGGKSIPVPTPAQRIADTPAASGEPEQERLKGDVLKGKIK